MTTGSTGSLLRDILIYESRLSSLIEQEKINASKAVAEAEAHASLIIANAHAKAENYRTESGSDIKKEYSRISGASSERIIIRINAIESSFNQSSSLFAAQISERILRHGA
jgi:vacuolar-type H+-ATPase subunit H